MAVYYMLICPSRLKYLTHKGMGGNLAVFCPLLKNSSGNPYLKILDFSQLFIADEEKNTKFLFYPRAEHFWDNRYKNIFFFF